MIQVIRCTKVMNRDKRGGEHIASVAYELLWQGAPADLIAVCPLPKKPGEADYFACTKGDESDGGEWEVICYGFQRFRDDTQHWCPCEDPRKLRRHSWDPPLVRRQQYTHA